MASRGLGTLTLDLVADIGGFEKGMDQAARVADRRMRQLQTSVSQIGRVFATVTTAAATALTYFGKQAINTADDLSKLSQSTGLSTEFLSQLSYTADLSGTSLDEVSTGLARLSRNASDAASGLAAPQKAFDKLGVAVLDADGKLRDTEDLLLDLADQFARLEDGLAEAALAQEVFGRSGAALIPFLNQGAAGIRALNAEGDQFGKTITSAAGKAAEEFNDNLQRLGHLSTGIANQFAQAVLPTLVRTSTAFVDTANDINLLTKSLVVLETTLRGLEIAGSAATSAVERAGEILGGAVAIWVAQLRGEYGQGVRILEEVLEDQKDKIGDNAKDIVDIALGIVPAIENVASRTDKALKESVLFGDAAGAGDNGLKAAQNALDNIEKLAQGLEQQIATYEQGAAAIIAYRIETGDLAETFALAGAAAEPYRSTLVELTAQYEDLTAATKAAAEAEAEQQRVLAEVASIVAATRTPLERYEATIIRLNELSSTGALDPETYRRAAEAAQDAFEDATKIINVFAEEASRNVQDIIAGHLKDGFDEGAEGILKSFGELIRDILAQAIAADIGKALFGGMGVGSGGGFFDFLGGLFGGGRATGGPVAAGTAYMVGERGPEMFVPSVSGTVVPNGAIGGVTINQVVNIDGSNIGPDQMVTILDENNKKLKGEFLQELRRGTYS